MSFGVLTFSQDTFSGVGTISARVTLPSLGLIGAVSPVIFSGDSVVNVTTPPTELTADIGGTTVSGNAAISLGAASTFPIVGGVGTVEFAGDGSVTLPSISGTLGLTAVSIQGSVLFDITSGFSLSVGFTGPTEFTGTAVVTLPSIPASMGITAVDISGSSTFNITDSFELTSAIGTVTIAGNALVELVGLSITSAIDTNTDVHIFNAEDYSRERTVYVDFKDNFISNTVFIQEQNRTVYITEKPHLVSTTIQISEQSRVIYIREKQHELQSRIAKAA